MPRVPLRHLLLAVAVVAVGLLALADSYPWSGPVLLTLSDAHGVHATDLPLVTVTVSCVLLLGLAGRRELVEQR